jgi:hypothetical protein
MNDNISEELLPPPSGYHPSGINISNFYPEEGGNRFLRKFSTMYPITQRHIPEDLNTHHREKLYLFACH